MIASEMMRANVHWPHGLMRPDQCNRLCAGVTGQARQMLLLLIGRCAGLLDLVLFLRQILVFGFRLALQLLFLLFLLR